MNVNETRQRMEAVRREEAAQKERQREEEKRVANKERERILRDDVPRKLIEARAEIVEAAGKGQSATTVYVNNEAEGDAVAAALINDGYTVSRVEYRHDRVEMGDSAAPCMIDRHTYWIDVSWPGYEEGANW